jgi:hypothetical protein
MRVLQAPTRVETDRAESTLRHALGAIAEREGRILRVIYRQSAHSRLIVTAFFDRAETRKRRS